MAGAPEPRRMILNAFSMNCVSHIQQGMWTRKDTRQVEFGSLDPWIELAKVAEKGCFDTIFLADVIGLYDNYKGSANTSFREAMQVPVNDPMLLIPAMASVTEHLGFAFTSSVLQAHPFTFARQLSTLDHLTKGRVAWNVVTSYLPNAGTNLGFEGLPTHEERYGRAEEYLEVVYKLLEGSWADDAVIDDRERRVYVDPDRVRPINHHGSYYDVAGPHLSAPSIQRTPVLFQAGMSERGRDFAAQHAECVFVVGPSRSGSSIAADLHTRAQAYGRAASDLKLIGGVAPIVGGTEAEAMAKRDEYENDLSIEAGLAHISGNIGADLGDIDPDHVREARPRHRQITTVFGGEHIVDVLIVPLAGAETDEIVESEIDGVGKDIGQLLILVRNQVDAGFQHVQRIGIDNRRGTVPVIAHPHHRTQIRVRGGAIARVGHVGTLRGIAASRAVELDVRISVVASA